MPRKPKPTARDKIAQAIAHLDDGNYAAAVSRLREAADIVDAAAQTFSAKVEKSIGAKPPTESDDGKS